MSPLDPDASGSAAGGPGAAGARGAAGNGGGGNGNGNGHGGSVRTVVPTRAELLLVSAERQLAREAAARGGTVRLRPTNTVVVGDEIDDQWGVVAAPPRRRVVTVVDPDDLEGADRRALGRLRARKVRRIVRHISPWSVFKVSVLFYLCLWLILLVSGVILWRVAQQAGVIENFGKLWAKATGEKYVDIDGRGVFRAAAAAGAILVFAATGFTVLMTVLFNLITDLVGGVRLTVIELERTKREVRRRAKSLDEARALAAEGGDVVVEDDEPEPATAEPAPAAPVPARTVRVPAGAGSGADPSA